jgi:imidazolonepropionase-like amidohydrolase
MLTRAIITFLFLLAPVCAAQAQATLALTGATIYTTPSAEPIRDGVVVIESGRISAVGPHASVKIPSGAEVIDCSGRAITAGFWDAHVHFMDRKWFDAATIPAGDLGAHMQETFTRYGFTAVYDVSSVLENTTALRKRIEAGEIPGPRILTTGLAMLPVNPQLPKEVYEKMGWMPTTPPELADAAAADATVSATLKGGADGIKLFISAPSKTTLALPVIRAATAEAHRLGAPVFVHPNSNADIIAAAEGGADIIAHTTPLAGPWDDAVLAAMEDRDVALVPTLGLWKYLVRNASPERQSQVVETEFAQLRAWLARGGTVIFGTDYGAVQPGPAEDYALMAAAGMNVRAILASLTTAPAKRFGRGADLGAVALGFRADLVVLKEDPASDPRKLAEVQFTLRDGKVIYRAP